MVEVPPLEEGEYAEFWEIDKPVIKFEGGVNEIQHKQRSLIKIAEEQTKDKVWSEVISWVNKDSYWRRGRQEVKQDKFK